MAAIELRSYTVRQAEMFADQIKVAILQALVADKTLPQETADEWAEMHTVLLRPKSLFRTLTDKWRKAKTEQNADCVIVVKAL